MNDSFGEMLARDLKLAKAMDAVWRRVLRSLKRDHPLKTRELVAAVQARCPWADAKRVEEELRRRAGATRLRKL
jgi:hypothetical protein